MKLKSFLKTLFFNALSLFLLIGGFVTYAVLFPGTTPSGEVAGGTFQEKFNEIYDALSFNGDNVTVEGNIATILPTENDHSANKEYVDTVVSAAGSGGGGILTLIGGYDQGGVDIEVNLCPTGYGLALKGYRQCAAISGVDMGDCFCSSNRETNGFYNNGTTAVWKAGSKYIHPSSGAIVYNRCIICVPQ